MKHTGVPNLSVELILPSKGTSRKCPWVTAQLGFGWLSAGRAPGRGCVLWNRKEACLVA